MQDYLVGRRDVENLVLFLEIAASKNRNFIREDFEKRVGLSLDDKIERIYKDLERKGRIVRYNKLKRYDFWVKYRNSRLFEIDRMYAFEVFVKPGKLSEEVPVVDLWFIEMKSTRSWNSRNKSFSQPTLFDQVVRNFLYGLYLAKNRRMEIRYSSKNVVLEFPVIDKIVSIGIHPMGHMIETFFLMWDVFDGSIYGFERRRLPQGYRDYKHEFAEYGTLNYEILRKFSRFIKKPWLLSRNENYKSVSEEIKNKLRSSPYITL